MTPFLLKMTIGAPVHLPLTRAEVVDHIEQLVTLLDKMDGDPDAEPDLGWSGTTYSIGSADDREDDAGDDREMCEDREWSLGSLEVVDQRAWSQASSNDLEAGI